MPAAPEATEPRWQPFADVPPVPQTPSATSAAPTPPAPEIATGGATPDPAFTPAAPSDGSIPPAADPSEVPSSAWITTAPTVQTGRATSSSGTRNLVATIVGVVAVLVIGYFAVQLLPSDKGKVLFGTTPGADLCSVGNQTTTVKTTDDLFFAAVLKDHMDGDQAITLRITKNGADFINYNEPADGTAFDCYGNRTSLAELGPFEAGQYHFEITNNGKIEAVGDLTITAT